MATLTTHPHTGNGSKGIAGQTPALLFSFDFLPNKTEDIKVSLNGKTLATTEYDVIATPASIQFKPITGTPTTFQSNTQVTEGALSGAPLDGVKILIYRDTSVTTAHRVFGAGGAIKAADLFVDLDSKEKTVQPTSEKEKPTVTEKNK